MSRAKTTARPEEQATDLAVDQAAPLQGATAPADGAQAAEQPPTTIESAPVELQARASSPVPETVAARVLCAGALGGRHFAAGVVVDGISAQVAQAHAHMLDLNPAAITHAIGAGAQAFGYGEG